MKNLLLRRLFLLVFFSSIFIIGVSQELVTSNYTKFIKVDYMVYDMNQDNEKTDDEIVDIDSRVYLDFRDYSSAGNTIKVRFVLYKGGETLEFNHIYSNIKFYVAKEQGLINYVLFDRYKVVKMGGYDKLYGRYFDSDVLSKDVDGIREKVIGIINIY